MPRMRLTSTNLQASNGPRCGVSGFECSARHTRHIREAHADARRVVGRLVITNSGYTPRRSDAAAITDALVTRSTF